ncbi:unnamed protein product [Dicrocoelium dendriticum]|nr:unnamed protein product [Dicrocoelium dendriticum]
MWYEILPSLGIMLACVVVYPPIQKSLAYLFYGRWSGTNFFRYRYDFALHVRDRNLVGRHHVLRGVEVIESD